MTPKRKDPDLSTYQGRCGLRLRTLRERKGITVEELADKLGVSYGAVYRWERGDADPPLRFFPQLATLFGLKSPRLILSAD